MGGDNNNPNPYLFGLNQNQAYTQTGIPAFQPPSPSTAELVFRSLAAGIPRNLKTRTVGGAIGSGLLQGLAGYAGVMGDELARQRNDPFQRQLAIAGQIQQMGTAASPIGPTPQLSPATQFSAEPEGASGIAPAPLPTQVGPPKFDIGNLPASVQIAAAPLLAPLTQQEAAKQQIAASKAATALSEAHLPLVAAQTANTQAEAAKRAQDIQAGNDFRTGIVEFRKNNPGISERELAKYAGELALKTGAPDAATKGFLDSITTTGTLAYHDKSLELLNKKMELDRQQHREDQARLASQFNKTLEANDIQGTRQILAAQMSRQEDMIRNGTNQLRNLATAEANARKTVADLTAKPQDIKEAKELIADIQSSRDGLMKQLEEDRRTFGHYQAQMSSLGEMTKAGKTISQIPAPAPPVQIENRITSPGTMKTLEDFLRYKRRTQ